MHFRRHDFTRDLARVPLRDFFAAPALPAPAAMTITRALDGGDESEGGSMAESAAEQQRLETNTERRQVDSCGPPGPCPDKSGASSGHRRRPSAEWERWALSFRAEEAHRRDRDEDGTEVASAVAMAIALSILAGLFVIVG